MPGKNARFEVFEGIKAEEYKRMRNKWLRLAVVGTVLPFVMGVLISVFNQSFSLSDFFGNGEMILLLFSLNLPLIFDIFDIKKHNDERLNWVFWFSVIIVCFQVLLYCLIRTTDSESSMTLNILTSLILIIISWIICAFSIKIMFQHSNTEGGERDDK